MKSFKAIGKNVLLEMQPRQEFVSGLIAIPEFSRKTANRGVVRSAGEKCADVVEGDVVIIGDHAGTKLDERGKDFVVVNEDHILAKEVA